ncbi:class I tRNA ligase family protein, partial [Candidatus Gottesmanbacteria bacterium]|nr:class I tRNA ligase family protein [Candidatus Gottesmanbacteria bacterium]
KYQISNDKLKEIADYVEKGKKKKPQERIAEGREKTGVFTGLYCLNQLNDYKMPLFISDFVLVEFGTGAVVGVPGHDKRDFEFAKKFKLPIKRVVVGSDGDKSPIKQIEQVQEEEGKMINSDFLDGMDIHEATKVMMDYLEEKGWGKRVTTYRLRDWCISRQRYWGAPIPMVYCSTCASEGRSWFTSQEAKDSLGNFKFQISNLKSNPNSKNLKAKISEEIDGWYPINEENLPVLLPDLSDWQPEGTGKGPLAKLKDWVKVKCPNCGGDADRETDVCDTFLDSSWYHLRYPSVNKVEKVDKVEESRFNPSTSTTSSTFSLPWDPEITKKWLPVTQYIGGAEHTVLHLLYARFVSMAFYDWKIIDFDEPYSRFFAHGLIIAEGAKMSKSRGNVIVPDEYIRAYGADTLRTYLMFLGPFEAGGDFRDTGIAGMYRFLSRVYRLVNEYFSSDPKQLDSLSAKDNADRLNKIMHKTIKDVTEDIAQFHYNTAIAKIMEYVNFLTNNKSLITNNHIKSLLLMLAPFAPHMTEELWQLVNSQSKSVPAKGGVSRSQSEFKSIHLEAWPEYNPKFLVEDEVTIAVQVNGKTRETLTMENGKWKMENEVRKKAEESEKVKKYTVGKKIKKVIFVPGKIINFVI